MSVATLPRVPADAAACAVLAALAGADDPVAAVVAATAALAGAPCAALWRRDDTGRLLLAYRHGEAGDDADGGQGSPGVAADDEGSVAPGLPLELAVAPDDVGVMRLQGRAFAALGLPTGVIALGPLGRDGLRRRDRARLEVLRATAAPAVEEAGRRAALAAELEGLRRELEMQRRTVREVTDDARAYGLLLDLAVTSAGAGAGLVAVRDPDGERFSTAAARALPVAFAGLDLTPGAGLLAEIPGLPGILVVEDPEALLAAGVTGLLAVSGPAAADSPTVIVGLATTGDETLPDDAGVLLETLVEQAALVQHGAAMARESAVRHLGALMGLGRALDARAPVSAAHHPRVARAAWILAGRVGMAPEECRVVHQAALVHDVGLLAAGADDVLAAEFAHPELGAEMAALVPGAADLAPVIRGHHEWWDGFGFPAGLAGESIPRGARVLAAAEFYVEMLESGHPGDAAGLVEEVRARRGTQLDPACADAIVTLVQECS